MSLLDVLSSFRLPNSVRALVDCREQVFWLISGTEAFSSLPEHIDERKICNAVTPDKDVDGFHVINVGRMCLDQYSMLPATPWGVWEIIKRTGKLLQYLAAGWHNCSLSLV